MLALYPEPFTGQKAPRAKRCIKTETFKNVLIGQTISQKAPSAKMCIKTKDLNPSIVEALRGVRKHRAPKGALRRRRLAP